MSIEVDEYKGKDLSLSLGMYYTFNTFTTGECKPKPDSDIRITVMSLTSESSSNMISFIDNAYHSTYSDKPNYCLNHSLYLLIIRFKNCFY